MANDDDSKSKASEHAQALSSLGAAKGGVARALSLTPEERSEISRHAAEKRWARGDLPREKYVGTLRIGEKEIPCAVLDNGIRVLSTRGVNRAMGSKTTGTPKTAREGARQLPSFLASKAIRPLIPQDLTVRVISPVEYKPLHGGRSAFGFEAKLLPDICKVILEADKAGSLRPSQKHLVETARILLHGFSEVGIIALVDEATGYQDVRAKDALAKILEAFIAKELRKWVSTFPVDYYKELFRLRGWHFPQLPADQRKRPVLVGKITNDVVYDRLAPGVRTELHRLTPRDDKGRLKNKLFQRLTNDVGHPKLREHLTAVTSLMKASDSWRQFMGMMNRALPRYGDTPYLPFEG